MRALKKAQRRWFRLNFPLTDGVASHQTLRAQGEGFAMGSMRNLIGAAAALAFVLLPACTRSTAQSSTAALAEAEEPLTRLAQDPTLQWGPCPDIFLAGCEIAVLHGDPARPSADVFLRAAGGYEFPAHSHTSAERMILVSGQMNVQYQGAQAATLTAGAYAYGPAGRPHRAACVSPEPCVLFIAFVGPVDAAPYEGSLE
jgi:mannose-6-phosphate isomerase-like protein (cupin superfamily)